MNTSSSFLQTPLKGKSRRPPASSLRPFSKQPSPISLPIQDDGDGDTSSLGPAADVSFLAGSATSSTRRYNVDNVSSSRFPRNPTPVRNDQMMYSPNAQALNDQSMEISRLFESVPNEDADMDMVSCPFCGYENLDKTRNLVLLSDRC